MLIALILVIVVGGFLVGAIARWAVPGPDPMPWWGTVLLGWTGSLLGGLLAHAFLGRAGGIVFAVVGSVILLVLYRRFVQHRPLTGPGAHEPPPRRRW